MGISQKAFNWKQRKRANTMSMKDHMEEAAARDRTPLQNNEKVCKSCGFKARYPFIRCPECGQQT